MFDGDTYASYVAGTAPREAQRLLGRWSRNQIRSATLDAITDSLATQLEIRPITIDEESSGWVWNNPKVPTEGGVVRVHVKFPRRASPNAYFELTPSTRQGHPGTARFDGSDIVVDGLAASNALRAVEAVKANIHTLNRDLEQSRQTLWSHVRSVVEARIREINAEEEAAAREVDALRGSGLRVLNEPELPAPLDNEPSSLSVGEPHSAVVGDSSTDSDDKPPRLSYVSELVSATTREKARVRALNLVEELAQSLASSKDGDERIAGQLALVAVNGLREYVDTELTPPNRRDAWEQVVEAAVAFLPHGREGLALAHALHDLARTYGMRWSGPLPDDLEGDEAQVV